MRCARARTLLPLFALAAIGLLTAAPVAAAEVEAAADVTVDAQVLQAEQARVEVMARVAPSVVAVFSTDGAGGGSGVLISRDGFALTNFHVVQPCGPAMQCGLNDGKTYDAVVVGVDPTGDVAVIKLFGRDDFPAAEIGDSSRLQLGDNVFAMGNPFLLATDFQPTVTYGIVSGLHRYQPPSGTILEYTDCIQTDASINPGNSGGPLFDMRGQLVGINGRGSFEKRGRVNVGLAYAVSVNQIKNFLGALQGGRIVDHASLGAVTAVDDRDRVIISDILEESDAYRRGLRYGDEVLSLAGRAISTPNAFQNVLGVFPKGWRVPLEIRRDGQTHQVLVRLRGAHGVEELAEIAEGEPQAMPGLPPEPKPEKEGQPPEGDKPPEGGAPTPMPGGAPKPAPKRGPRPLPGAGPAAPLPAAIQPYYEKRHGFANYYFNRQLQQEVWRKYRRQADLTSFDGTWTLSGSRSGPEEFTLTWTENGLTLLGRAGASPWIMPENSPPTLDPPESGGLFLALHLWRRLQRLGPTGFDHVVYEGTAPLPGQAELLDVLAADYRGIECRLYFNRENGRLAAMEVYPQVDADPCELYFSDYRTVQGQLLPGQIEARYGDRQITTLFGREWQLHTAAETASPAAERAQ